MGLREEIFEIFFTKISANEEVPKLLVEKLKELFDSEEITEASLLNILEETIIHE